MKYTFIQSFLSILTSCLLVSSTHSFGVISTTSSTLSSLHKITSGPPQISSSNYIQSNKSIKKNTILSMGFLEDVGSSLFGGGKNEEESVAASSVDASIPTRVIEINASKIKVGGLRFTLGLIFMSLQNQPEPNTWKANQSNDGALDMYFMKDNTAMVSITMTDESFCVDRYGAAPSLVYMLQESLLVHSILDELDGLAFGVEGEEDDIKEENRLIVFDDDNKDTISLARESLPARKA